MLMEREHIMIEKVRPIVEFEVQFVLDELSSTIQQQREEIGRIDQANVRLLKDNNQLKQENERLIEAVKSARLSLTWCNTDQQIPAAVWHLEQVLPKAIEATE